MLFQRKSEGRGVTDKNRNYSTESNGESLGRAKTPSQSKERKEIITVAKQKQRFVKSSYETLIKLSETGLEVSTGVAARRATVGGKRCQKVVERWGGRWGSWCQPVVLLKRKGNGFRSMGFGLPGEMPALTRKGKEERTTSKNPKHTGQPVPRLGRGGVGTVEPRSKHQGMGKGY